LQKLASHFLPVPAATKANLSHPSTEFKHRLNFHTLSPTYFLPRAAAIEPEVLEGDTKPSIALLTSCRH
jgi:hypothetical protein